ncbi:hypothetical protein [Actinoplanes philippinensis]|uniref:hypothetical protein n=1 Tax=Actinoplanes philippinensis TaxID=35752 RepID=UPI001EF3C66C|nr:hypothetical protein [Actinoplanes philippinensis]
MWSFYSPDAAALAEELAQIRGLADGPNGTHLAGGVHATAEPVQTLDAGWDMAAIGEGDPTGITGLAYRDATGNLIRTGKAKQRDLHDFPGFALTWDRFNALEVARGCIYACRFKRQLLPIRDSAARFGAPSHTAATDQLRSSENYSMPGLEVSSQVRG